MLHNLGLPASKGMLGYLYTILSFFILLGLINDILSDALQRASAFLRGTMTNQLTCCTQQSPRQLTRPELIPAHPLPLSHLKCSWTQNR